jgi:hypothetical protein
MQTLTTIEKVGASVLGTALLSPRREQIPLGKCAPCLRTTEDVEGALRCGFLDSTLPIEFNILDALNIQHKLAIHLNDVVNRPDYLHPHSLIANRSSIGYIPPECFYEPNDKAMEALANTGPIGGRISELRRCNSDASFWIAVANSGLYPRWLVELLQNNRVSRGDLLAPPVPPVIKDIQASPEMQIEVNKALTGIWSQIAGKDYSEMGLMYSLHIAPSALESPDLVRRALLGLNEVLSNDDSRFWGIHLHFTDVRFVTNKVNRVELAKEVAGQAAGIGSRHGIFTMVSDVGAIGPALLDLGVAFATYSSAMTPRRRYAQFGVDDPDLKFGKVIGLWNYFLHDRPAVRRRGDRMEETGLYSPEVPNHAKGEKTYKAYRVDFAKPYSISVMERLNIERAKELQTKKNAKPGHSHIGRSRDVQIAPWA